MAIAHIFAQRSTCNRLHVGAVIARDGRILSTGYNGPAAGMPHCEHDMTAEEPCQVAVHAEANAIAWAAREGVATNNAQLYVTHSPCIHCAKLIINAGLTIVYYGELFRDVAGIDYLKEAGLSIGHV